MDNVKYIIKVKKVGTEKKIVGKEWRKLKDDDEEGNTYGYTPEIEKEEEVEIDIYEQTVECLDLVAVIKAVNNLHG